MTASDASCDFLYVHTDIPEGMTIRQWRARRAADRPTRHRWRSSARAAAGGVSRATARPSRWLRFLALVGARDGALILEVTDELDAG